MKRAGGRRIRKKRRHPGPTGRPGGSGGQQPGGVVVEAGDGAVHESAGGLGGDAELVTDLTEAMTLTVGEPEAGLDGAAGAGVETAEEVTDDAGVGVGQHDLVGPGQVGRHQIAERGVAVDADGAIERGGCGEPVQFGVHRIEVVGVADTAQFSAEVMPPDHPGS